MLRQSVYRLALAISTACTAILLVFASACATTGTEGDAGTSTRTGVSNRNVISQEELSERSYANMHDVISRIRPNWLRTAGTSSEYGTSASGGVTVFLDGQRLGGLENLRQMSAQSVSEARYLSASAAQSRYGLQTTTPVIEITTKLGTRR